MTELELKRRAINNFKNYEIPKHTKRNYQRQWIQCIRTLGPKWRLAAPIQRCTGDNGTPTRPS
jgi:hypothetical protein